MGTQPEQIKHYPLIFNNKFIVPDPKQYKPLPNYFPDVPKKSLEEQMFDVNNPFGAQHEDYGRQYDQQYNANGYVLDHPSANANVQMEWILALGIGMMGMFLLCLCGMIC